MVITQTPFRMSFFGGGTDYQPFFEKYGGSVISTTFDKYCYVIVRHLPRFFEYKNQVIYRKIEKTGTVDEIEHSAVRNAMKMLDMHELHITYDSDLPARSGLGSSSSFAVGMLNGFYALKGKYAGKEQLAKDSIYLERDLCDESGGWQDQIAAAYGGLNRIDFHGDEFTVNPIIISNERKHSLNKHLMLFFTGFTRFSSDIAAEQIKATHDKTAELKEMLSLVDDGEKILTSKCNITEFGKLLDYTWKIKRGITPKISNNTIDGIYSKALESGAIGGKLMGAGGGGFLMLFAEPDKQPKVQKALSELLYVPFEFEDDGSKIMYYKPEDYDLPIGLEEVN